MADPWSQKLGVFKRNFQKFSPVLTYRSQFWLFCHVLFMVPICLPGNFYFFQKNLQIGNHFVFCQKTTFVKFRSHVSLFSNFFAASRSTHRLNSYSLVTTRAFHDHLMEPNCSVPTVADTRRVDRPTNPIPHKCCYYLLWIELAPKHTRVD